MLIIRDSQPSDAAQLASLGLRSWRSSIGRLVTDDVIAAMVAQNPFVSFIQDMGHRLLVAELDGHTTGFAGREHNGECITDLWVSPDCEGRGIGRSLLDKMEEAICNAGYHRARIDVAADNQRALSLYLHRGYEIIWQGLEQDAILGVSLQKCHLEKHLSDRT